jgi:hypothetical protein
MFIQTAEQYLSDCRSQPVNVLTFGQIEKYWQARCCHQRMKIGW